jgi:type IV secretory pathway VirB10-like protein
MDMKHHFGWRGENTSLKYMDETKDRSRKMAKMLTVGSVAPSVSPPATPPPPPPPPPPPSPPHLPVAASSGTAWAVVSAGTLPLGATVLASAPDTTFTSSQFQAQRTVSDGLEVTQEQVMHTVQVATGAKEESSPGKLYNISVGHSSTVTLNFQ